MNKSLSFRNKIRATEKWLGAESNRRHADFQSAALPTELPSRDRRRFCAVSWGSHYGAISLQGKAAKMIGTPLNKSRCHVERSETSLVYCRWEDRFKTDPRFSASLRMTLCNVAVRIGRMKKIVSTNEAPGAIGPYSQAVRSGSLLFCSGQIPLDPKSGQIVSGDIAVQTRRVLDNVAAVLRAEGLTFDNVVKTTIFLTDLGDFQTVNEVYSSYFKQDPPARSTVQVSALPKGAKIEVEAIAAAAEAQQTAYDTSG